MTPFLLKMPGMRLGSDFIHLWNLGDLHLGNRGFCYRTFKRDRARIIKDPLARVILMGDLGEYICLSDKRFDLHTVEPDLLPYLDDVFNRQTEMLAELLYPITRCECASAKIKYRTIDIDAIEGELRRNHTKIQELGLRGEAVAKVLSPCKLDVVTLDAMVGKVWYLLSSNHGQAARRRFSNNVNRQLARELKVPLFSYSAYGEVRVDPKSVGKKRHDQQCSFSLFAHHGAGGGRLRGGKVNRLDEVSGFFSCDVAVMGHVHERMDWDSPSLHLILKDGEPHIQARPRKMLLAGTYLRTYTEGFSGYGEEGLYRPTALGAKPLTIRWERSGSERHLVLE